MVDYSGLAMVHGSKRDPEAFLSATDTKMMRSFLDSVRFSTPSGRMANVPQFGAGSGDSFVIEQITISVEKIDDQRDLDKLANQVGEHFAKAITSKRGISIGNLKIR